MRKGSFILSVFSVLLLTAIIAASTGFTVVTHVCKMCGISSMQTEYLFDKSSTVDPCCDNPADEDQSNMSFKSEQCCTFHAEQLKVTNYLPEVYHAPVTDLAPACIYYIDFSSPVKDPAGLSLPKACEKYGGGSVLSLCRQLLI